jgi:hypothetical protein
MGSGKDRRGGPALAQDVVELLDRLDSVHRAARHVVETLGLLPVKGGEAAWVYAGLVDDPGLTVAVLNALGHLDRVLYPLTVTDTKGREARLPFHATLGQRARLLYREFVRATGEAPLSGKVGRQRYRGSTVAVHDLLGPTPAPHELRLAACAVQQAHVAVLDSLGVGPCAAGELVECPWRWPRLPAVPPGLLERLDAAAGRLVASIERCREALGRQNHDTDNTDVRPTRRCRLDLRDGTPYLDGEAVVLNLTAEARGAAMCFLGHLIRAGGHFISSTDINQAERGRPQQGLSGIRWDRVRKTLPDQLLALTESQRRKGYRLPQSAWGAWNE